MALPCLVAPLHGSQGGCLQRDRIKGANVTLFCFVALLL